MQSYGVAGRIDVLGMSRWTGRLKFDLAAYEVKVSKPDFQRDVQAGKWTRYADEFGIPRISFAFPEGLVDPIDVPPNAGVIVLKGKSWVVKRGARPMVHDQRKLDPLLLLGMLSQPYYDPARVAEEQRWKRIREALPAPVFSVLREVPDSQYASWLRNAALANGHELAKRLATPRPDIDRVHAWAERIVELAAQSEGVSTEDLLERIRRGGNDDRWSDTIGRAMKRALRIRAHRPKLEQLLSAMSAALDIGYFAGEGDEALDEGLATLAAINDKELPAKRKRLARA